jgi:ABC-2 type transport system permease protein
MSINWIGANSLLKKEILRFLKVYHQTLFSPVVNIILFLAVFSLSVGSEIKKISNVDFAVFVSAGLIMMAAMQNAFANSSSSFVMSKVLGHIVDFIIPPLQAIEIIYAFVIGAIIRGIAVAIIAFLVISIFVNLTINNFYLLLFYLTFSCAFLGLMGILCGIIANSFDQMSAVTSYIITPLTFLSGTFYSIESLPIFWQKIAHFNPFFQMINGFRYAITGYSDGNILVGICYILAINVILLIVIYILLKKGIGIKN